MGIPEAGRRNARPPNPDEGGNKPENRMVKKGQTIGADTGVDLNSE
jgi:hypothetical protein